MGLSNEKLARGATLVIHHCDDGSQGIRCFYRPNRVSDSYGNCILVGGAFQPLSSWRENVGESLSGIIERQICSTCSHIVVSERFTWYRTIPGMMKILSSHGNGLGYFAIRSPQWVCRGLMNCWPTRNNKYSSTPKKLFISFELVHGGVC